MFKPCNSIDIHISRPFSRNFDSMYMHMYIHEQTYNSTCKHTHIHIFTYKQNNWVFGVYDYMDIILWYTGASSIWLVRSSYTLLSPAGTYIDVKSSTMGVFPSWKSANTISQSKFFSLGSQFLTFNSTPLCTHAWGHTSTHTHMHTHPYMYWAFVLGIMLREGIQRLHSFYQYL